MSRLSGSDRGHQCEKPVSTRRHVLNGGRPKHLGMKSLASVGDAIHRRSLPCPAAWPTLYGAREWGGAAVLANLHLVRQVNDGDALIVTEIRLWRVRHAQWRSSGLTTQAQRRRPRGASIATATARRRSLQRMVRPQLHK